MLNGKDDFSSLKSKVDKLNIGKSETTPVDLIKLSNVKTDVVTKSEYNAKIKMLKIKYLILQT